MWHRGCLSKGVILTPGADKALGRSSFSWCPVARARGERGRRPLWVNMLIVNIICCSGALCELTFGIMPRPALGLIETSGIDGAIEATRAASDAGQVVIVSAERTDADRMTVKIEGDWSAVQTAIEAGARAADKSGQFLSMHVIPRSDNGVSPILPYPRFVDRYQPDQTVRPRKQPGPPKPPKKRSRPKPNPTPTEKPVVTPVVETPPPPVTEPVAATSAPAPSGDSPEPPWAELQSMPVVKLRKYARSVPELPIKGRQISKANKEQLLEVLASVGKGRQ